MLKRIMTILSYRKQFVSLLVGVPSYDTYVAHMRKHHPGDPVKTRKEFFCEAQDERYNAKGGKVSRCC
ncbi:YbdD/YjiX family protein [Peribacillus castrilensis]|uniref:Cytoplasmic protein n=1 Tax=Peribacillus simplex TaxID=1478 RepID=A0AAN2TQZ1_9BACI|nr:MULTISPECIES: YbdD/YjiX family protein [Bacillaceae]MCP1097271.1 YbdD/YjiX family protein [Bacillaceae bacterium OS4b]MBD8590801.1 YbdD/YjiX family protein [Peribacillus simplex]MCF7620705.1 YbdD/YjiX family protein [Peribacillus frigoritolerans]MCP1151362.1 YbdD/YjiX family protein [Peribacillus frigoritolerans]MCT1388025.1 YbdD/YjiX family protein [Peribacillus frigoritolerans]